MDLTNKSKEIFLEYAEAAESWIGNPPVSVEISGGKTIEGSIKNLSDIINSGLITLFKTDDEGDTVGVWIKFTEKGKKLAAENGITIIDDSNEKEEVNMIKKAKVAKVEEKNVRAETLVAILGGAAKEGRMNTETKVYTLTSKEMEKIRDITKFIFKGQNWVIDKEDRTVTPLPPSKEIPSVPPPPLPEKTEDESKSHEPKNFLLYKKGSTDFLMWVGNKFRLIGDYEKVAEEKGVSQSITVIPKNFKPGVSRLFVAHDEGIAKKSVIIGYAVLGDIFQVSDSEKVHPEPDVKYIEESNAAKRGMTGIGKLYLFGSYTKLEGYVGIHGEEKRKKILSEVNGEGILRCKEFCDAPSKAIQGTMGIEGGAKKAETHWSTEEKQALIDLVKECSAFPEASRRFILQTNRTKHAVDYMWYHTMKKEGLR